ncbi:hypothetical protein B0H10DRAFT_1944841 [Mycena sp. CBHHK59/15]|nr:hypothetical protein B0H10DRAFT_1944841 [Mycena sp. CBHHK59/15]
MTYAWPGKHKRAALAVEIAKRRECVIAKMMKGQEAGGVNGLGGSIAANIEGGGFQKDLERRDSAGSRGETSSVHIPATLWQNGRTREQDDVARRTTLWQNEPEGTALWARNTTTITQISEQHTRGRRVIVSNERLRVEAPTEKQMAPTNRLRAVGGGWMSDEGGSSSQVDLAVLPSTRQTRR